MSTTQLSPEETARLNRLMRAKIVALVLSTEFEAGIGDTANDPAVTHYMNDQIAAICTEILGDISTAEYIRLIAVGG